MRLLKLPTKVILFLATLFVCHASYALIVTEPKTQVNSQDVSVLLDPEGSYKFDDIRSNAFDSKFQRLKADSGQTDFGFTTDTIWLKISIQKSHDEDKAWILEIPYLGLDSVQLYNPDGSSQSVGGLQPAELKPIYQRFDAFPITLKTDAQDFFLRVQSQYSISIPLVLWEIHAYSAAKFKDNFLQALYFGAVVALVLYNLLLYVSLRERRFLLYVLFATFIGLGMFAGNGYGHLLLWPNFPKWNAISQTVFISIAVCFSFLFVQNFLKTKETLPLLDKGLMAILGTFFAIAILLVLSMRFNFNTLNVYRLFMLMAAISSPYIFFICLKRIWQGNRSAKYLLLAFGTIWTGGLIASLRAFNLLPTNAFTSYSLQIGSAFEIFLLSFALANQIRIDRSRRNEAEKIHEQYIRFSALISHEFRTPLNAIQSQAALLEREAANGLNNLALRTQSIMVAVQHLSHLFTRWSQADRLKHAMTQVDPKVIDIYTWLGIVIDRCRQFYSNHTIELDVDPATQFIWADDELLQIALMNLIDNACKYSPNGSVILVGTNVQDRLTGIFVTDKGCGISTKEQSRVFDEYVRLENPVDIGGIGLGLAFVKKIMDLHAGHVELTSQPGLGSTFTLWFSNKREH